MTTLHCCQTLCNTTPWPPPLLPSTRAIRNRLPLPLLLCLCLAIVLFSPSPSSLSPAPLRASAYYVSEEGFMMDGPVEMPALRVTHSITLNQVDVGSLLTALQSQLSALAASSAAQAAQITALQSANVTAAGVISALTARVATAEGTVSTLSGRVAAAESAATMIAATVGSHAATISSHTTQIGALQTANTTTAAATSALAARVGTAESAAAALTTRVGNAETLASGSSALVAAVQMLQSANNTMADVAAALSGRLSAAESLSGGTALALTVGQLAAAAPCCGRTSPTATAWVASAIDNALFVDVDISACGFLAPPLISTSLGGRDAHWATAGATSIYPFAGSTAHSPNGFRIFLFPFGAAGSAVEIRTFTAANVAAYEWHINWCAHRA